MSLSWRVCRDAFSDLSGEGARLYGGRWNDPGHPVVYTADGPALAVLEVRVHLDLSPDLLPDDYVLMAINLGDLAVETLDRLPHNRAAFGTRWLKEARTTVLSVPSAIVAESRNLLINPKHADAGRIAIASKRRFRFDERLWLHG